MVGLDDGGELVAALGIYVALVVGAMLGCGFGGRALMKGKGRSGAAGFCLGFFLGLPGLLIAGLLSSTPEYEAFKMRRQMELMGIAPPTGVAAQAFVSPTGQFVPPARATSNSGGALGWSIAAAVVLLAWATLSDYGLGLQHEPKLIAPFAAVAFLIVLGAAQGRSNPDRAGLAVGAAAASLTTTLATVPLGSQAYDAQYSSLLPAALSLAVILSLKKSGTTSGNLHTDGHRGLLLGAGATVGIALFIQSKSGQVVEDEMWPGWLLQAALLVGVVLLAANKRSAWWRMAALGAFVPMGVTVIGGSLDFPRYPLYLILREPHNLMSIAVVFTLVALVVVQRQSTPATGAEVEVGAAATPGTFGAPATHSTPATLSQLTVAPAALVPTPPSPPEPTASNPARWAADPMGRHELRYWDGSKWSEHVSDGGVTSLDDVRTPRPAVVTPPSMATPLMSGRPATPIDPDLATISRVDQTAPRRAVAVTRPELVFDTGHRLAITAPVVIGRSPKAQASVPGAALFSFDDHTMSVSATHLMVGPDAAGVWVEDVGSTNGSEIVGSSGEIQALTPGVRVTVPVGTEVRFGDRSLRVGSTGSV